MSRFNKSKLDKLKKIDKLYKLIYLSPKNIKNYPPVAKEETKYILIVGMMMIGDTIMALPSLRVIRKNFASAHITLIGGDAVKTMLENQGLIDDFIIVKSPWLHNDYSYKNLFNCFRSLRIINRRKYDIAIDFKGDWRNILYMNFIGAIRKITFNYTGGEYMLTDVIEPNPHIDHYIDEWLYLLEQIGCEIHENDKIPYLSLNRTDIDYVRDFKSKNGLLNKFIIGLHPGASQEVKKWDEKKYAELIIKLSNDYEDFKFLIFEGPNETQTVMQVERILADNHIDYINVRKNLKEYTLILSICNLIICNDSGAAHIAGAFEIPTVVIFGNVDPKYVTPLGAKIKKVISHHLDCKPCHQNYCRFGTNLCIKEIEVDEVYNAAISVIKQINTIGKNGL